VSTKIVLYVEDFLSVFHEQELYGTDPAYD
jgi:hypothetical protein